MSRTIGVLIAIGLAGIARGEVRVFVTTSSAGYGLENQANAFQPTLSTVDADGNNINAYDYAHGHFRCSSYPPIDAPSGTAADPVEIAAGDWAYIWLQFVSEPNSSRINGLTVELRLAGGLAALTPTYYVQNDRGGNPSRKRWDGFATPPDYPEWHNNPQTLVAITANGIVSTGTDPQMMYKHQAGMNPRSGVGLLGAVPVPADGLTYEIAITDIHYSSGTPGPLIAGYFRQPVPEPASVALLAIVGTLAARRR